MEDSFKNTKEMSDNEFIKMIFNESLDLISKYDFIELKDIKLVLRNTETDAIIDFPIFKVLYETMLLSKANSMINDILQNDMFHGISKENSFSDLTKKYENGHKEEHKCNYDNNDLLEIIKNFI